MQRGSRESLNSYRLVTHTAVHTHCSFSFCKYILCLNNEISLLSWCFFFPLMLRLSLVFASSTPTASQYSCRTVQCCGTDKRLSLVFASSTPTASQYSCRTVQCCGTDKRLSLVFASSTPNASQYSCRTVQCCGTDKRTSYWVSRVRVHFFTESPNIMKLSRTFFCVAGRLCKQICL